MLCVVLSLSCRLPQKRVLTLNLELPESWLVEPVMALHDLDNLRLADIQEQVQQQLPRQCLALLCVGRILGERGMRVCPCWIQRRSLEQ